MSKKNLQQWLEYLESIHPSEIEMGLNRVRTVATNMQLIKPAKKIMLVAGTNGKGSTVTYSRSILLQCGFSVGTYMSPHLHVYNERVMIDDKMVSDDDLIESFEKIEQARGDISLTYFEVGTLSAYYLFNKYNVDCAVIEVGLGGRLDATNIVEPDVSVVTSVGMDHQDWLGNDISLIAYEKAGVYRADKPAICGEPDVDVKLIEHAQSIGANLHIKNKDYRIEKTEDSWSWFGVHPNGGVLHFHDLPLPSLPLENAGTALQALLYLYPELTQQQIIEGLSVAHLPGRLQKLSSPFNCLLDVGHNPQAAKLIAKHCQDTPLKGKRIALLAMLVDKDVQGVVSQLEGVIDEWYLAGINGYRGQTADQLLEKAGDLVVDPVLCETVAQALEKIQLDLGEDDEVIILGSFVTVAQAQTWLEG